MVGRPALTRAPTKAEGAGVRLTVASLMALSGEADPSNDIAQGLADRPGVQSTPRRGQGQALREIRPYIEGDDARHLDAAASARMGSPHLRSYHLDREQSLVLLADFRRPMLWGTQICLRSVGGAEALVSAAWAAQGQGASVGAICLCDDSVFWQAPRPKAAGMALVARCLETGHSHAYHHAAKAEAAAVTPLADGLRQVLARIPLGAAVILATGLDAPGEGLETALSALARRARLEVILVEDAFERSPPRRVLPHFRGTLALWSRFDDLAAARDRRAESLNHLIRPFGGRLRRLGAPRPLGKGG